LSKAHHRPAQRSDFIEAAHFYWRTYQQEAAQPQASASNGMQGNYKTPGGSSFEARAVRHTLGCLLARVDGRSPLEYFSSGEQQQQRMIALALIEKPPASVTDLVAEFGEGLARMREDCI
jgi:hypothetical protein